MTRSALCALHLLPRAHGNNAIGFDGYCAVFYDPALRVHGDDRAAGDKDVCHVAPPGGFVATSASQLLAILWHPDNKILELWLTLMVVEEITHHTYVSVIAVVTKADIRYQLAIDEEPAPIFNGN